MPTMIKTTCAYCKKEVLKSIKHVNEAKNEVGYKCVLLNVEIR